MYIHRMTMNSTLPNTLSRINPINVEAIWRQGNYNAFYQSSAGNFLDIAVTFWENHGELVAHVGTAVHVIIDGNEVDMITSVVIHSDGRLTNVSRQWGIMSGHMALDTFYLLLNPWCLSNWSLVDKDSVIENQKKISPDISREEFAANIWMKLPPLNQTSRFDQLRQYMERLQSQYIAISNQW